MWRRESGCSLVNGSGRNSAGESAEPLELILRQMAQKALDDLGNVKSGLTLVTEVAQAFDRGQNEQICEMLTRSLLDDVSTKYLDDALEFMALRRSLADNCPWDRGLLTQEFILDLFEDQIIKWEKILTFPLWNTMF